MSLFVALSKYRIKDTYATGQMLDYAMGSMPAKGFQLQELKNLMVATDGRPAVELCTYVLTTAFEIFGGLPVPGRPEGSPAFRNCWPRADGYQYYLLSRPKSDDSFAFIYVH